MGPILFPVRFFPSTLWPAPSLLQPPPDVAERLEAAVIAAAALQRIRKGDGENRLAPDAAAVPANPPALFEKRLAMPAAADGSAVFSGERPPLSLGNLWQSWHAIPFWMRWGLRGSFDAVFHSGNEKARACLSRLLVDMHDQSQRKKISYYFTFRKVVETLAAALALRPEFPVIGVVVRGDLDDRQWIWMDVEAMRKDFKVWSSPDFPPDVEVQIPRDYRPPALADGGPIGLERYEIDLATAQDLLRTAGPHGLRGVEHFLLSIPTASEVCGADLSSKRWCDLFFNTTSALISAVIFCIEHGIPKTPIGDRLLQRTTDHMTALQTLAEKGDAGDSAVGAMQNSVESLEAAALDVFWRRLPSFVRFVLKGNYYRILETQNMGARELCFQLVQDYGRTLGYPRLALGLEALAVALKRDPHLKIVKVALGGKEYTVRREPAARLVSGNLVEATTLWPHKDLPAGVRIYVWGEVSLPGGMRR